MAGRISQEVLEAAYLANKPTRLTQEVLEAAYLTAEPARLTQEVLEAAYLTLEPARLSQLVLEVMWALPSGALDKAGLKNHTLTLTGRRRWFG